MVSFTTDQRWVGWWRREFPLGNPTPSGYPGHQVFLTLGTNVILVLTVIQTAPILSNQFTVYMYTLHLTSCLAELSCGSHMETPDSPAQRWTQTALLPHSGMHPLQVKRDEFVSQNIPLKFAAFLERALCGLALSPGPLPLCFPLCLLWPFDLAVQRLYTWTFQWAIESTQSRKQRGRKLRGGKRAERGLCFRPHTMAP